MTATFFLYDSYKSVLPNVIISIQAASMTVTCLYYITTSGRPHPFYLLVGMEVLHEYGTAPDAWNECSRFSVQH